MSRGGPFKPYREMLLVASQGIALDLVKAQINKGSPTTQQGRIGGSTRAYRRFLRLALIGPRLALIDPRSGPFKVDLMRQKPFKHRRIGKIARIRCANARARFSI